MLKYNNILNGNMLLQCFSFLTVHSELTWHLAFTDCVSWEAAFSALVECVVSGCMLLACTGERASLSLIQCSVKHLYSCPNAILLYFCFPLLFDFQILTLVLGEKLTCQCCCCCCCSCMIERHHGTSKWTSVSHSHTHVDVSLSISVCLLPWLYLPHSTHACWSI